MAELNHRGGGSYLGGEGPIDPFEGFFEPPTRAVEADPLLDTPAGRRWMRLLRWGMENDLYTYQQPLEGLAGPRVARNGRELLLLSSYNYLGLTGHPALAAATTGAARWHGTSTSGVRLLTGSSLLHRELEQALAGFVGTEAALTFNSGYAANIGVISALFGRGDLVVADALVHRSVRDGCRVAGVPMTHFAHNDLEDLRRVLRSAPRDCRVCIVVEGVYSMEGDVCPLPGVVRLKHEFGAFLMIDEAHSLGVLGATGRGVAEHFGVPAEEVDLFTGSLNKAIPASGGYVAGRLPVVIYLQHRAAPFCFSSALAPPAAAAAKVALELIEAEPERLRTLWRNARLLRSGLADLGLDVGTSTSPLIPVITGSETRAYRLARDLLRMGVAVSAVVSPAVPRGRARLRLCATAAHNEEDIAEALDAFSRVRGRARSSAAKLDPHSRGLAVEIVEDLDRIDPREWNTLVGRDDPQASLEFVRICRDAGIEDAVYRHLLVRQSGRLAAVATLTRMTVSLDVLGSSWTRSLANRIRRWRPGFLRVPVLFCGLPVSFGQSPLRLAPEADRLSVVRLIADAMEHVGAELGCDLLCLKEFSSDELADVSALHAVGYFRAASLGYCRLPIRWSSHADYVSDMRAGYRRQARRDEANLSDLGMSVRVVENWISYSEQLHRLYINVMRRTRTKLETLPVSFFRRLASDPAVNSRALLLEDGGKTVGMAILLDTPRTMTFLLAGLEERRPEEPALYPILVNRVVAEAIRSGASRIDLGQTSNPTKTRFGAVVEPRWIYLRHRSRALHRLLKASRSVLFPQVDTPVRRVFRVVPGDDD